MPTYGDSSLRNAMDKKIEKIFNEYYLEKFQHKLDIKKFDEKPHPYQFAIIGNFFLINEIDITPVIGEIFKNNIERQKELGAVTDVLYSMLDFWQPVISTGSKMLLDKLFPDPRFKYHIGEIVHEKLTGKYKPHFVEAPIGGIKYSFRVMEKTEYGYMVVILHCDDNFPYELGELTEILVKPKPKSLSEYDFIDTTSYDGYDNNYYNDQLDMDQQSPEYWDNL